MKDPVKYAVSSSIPYGKHYVITHPRTRAKLKIIASNDDGWNHVSVSLEHRDPLWHEMTYVKKKFFDDEEICLQFHPKKSEYVNLHKHCLHLWQPPMYICEMLEDRPF